MDAVDEGMAHVLGRMDQKDRVHHTTLNNIQPKVYKLSITEIFNEKL